MRVVRVVGDNEFRAEESVGGADPVSGVGAGKAQDAGAERGPVGLGGQQPQPRIALLELIDQIFDVDA